MDLPVQSPGESEVFYVAGDEIRKRKLSCVTDALWEIIKKFSQGFHKLDEIGNNPNIGIRGFTT